MFNGCTVALLYPCKKRVNEFEHIIHTTPISHEGERCVKYPLYLYVASK